MATKSTPGAVVPGTRGVARVLAKLESSIASGNYYEAHQMYRTLYFRYLSQKKYDELLELLHKGALTLIEHKQYTSGADLVILIIDTLENAKITHVGTCLKWMDKIAVLLYSIPARIVERETLMVKAVKWSATVGQPSQVGHPMMHKHIAHMMWKEDNLARARHHFLLSKDGRGCGYMLIQLSQTGFASELDLFIAQVILQQLCLQETAAALETFATYTKYHPKIACSEPPFITPLLNFIFFLLQAVKANQRKLAVFRTLCDLYRPSLDRDPSYEKYLQKIGMIFFGASREPADRSQGMGGIFGDLLNQFFQGLDEELDDEPAGGSTERVGDGGSTQVVKEELD